MTERSLWKRDKISPEDESWPVFSKKEKGHCGDIAQITNVDKSTLSRIGKCLRSNDDVTLENLLCPST